MAAALAGPAWGGGQGDQGGQHGRVVDFGNAPAAAAAATDKQGLGFGDGAREATEAAKAPRGEGGGQGAGLGESFPGQNEKSVVESRVQALRASMLEQQRQRQAMA
eukprot:CAMPEP_0172634106 /NCGR_PEP_ID=MMETSP1068-20121228/192936_1 /TAXON_ID=35684 /ORGANISM="Pseudopedinella elastica, Strain CCMP716" /LENGTH=105 /DNA_ID=CAMNT_0013445979 /DNA_START=1 /DNA_END=315 /DNA_ORIENTATION=+